MSAIPESFRAYVVDGENGGAVRPWRADQLGYGDVVIKVSWSSVNFKDGLASKPDGKVARISPLVLGIDLVGTVADAGETDLVVGTPVVVHGNELGVAHHGGYSEYARVPVEWVVRLPEGLSAREAMGLGTAGFTAALSVDALEAHGLRNDQGPVLVTGASGGVGSTAVVLLSHLGYQVVASTGTESAHDWLHELGAQKVIDRSQTTSAVKPLQKEQWAGAVDCVGGDTLAYVLSTLRYGGAVAASGNTGGAGLSTTVFPFILRGASLLGVDSVQCPLPRRQHIWNRLGTDLHSDGLRKIGTEETTLEGISTALSKVLAGKTLGRTVVRVG